ncbi:MAG: thioredoxin-like negative regulator of GroEL, partial [Planctomycetaceae bacterium]
MSTASTPTEVSVRRFRWRRVGFFVLLLLAIVVGAYWLSRPDTATLMRRADLEFVRGDYDQTLETVERVLSCEPNHTAALVLAGDTSFAMEQYDRALDYYRRVPAGSSEAAIHAKLRCGRIEMHHTGNAVAAESDFRAALKHDPEDRNGLFQLASLLGIQSRRSEAVPVILRLFRQGVFDADFL